MTSEQVKKFVEQGIENLTTALEAGKSDTLIAYLKTVAKFHQYSFRNCMLISMQRPDATRIAGFRTWKKLNRFVKKGEKGIVIIAPIVIKKDDKKCQDNNDSQTVYFKATHVFDISQTDGDPLPEPSSVLGNPKGHLKRLKDFAQSRCIEIEYSYGLGAAYGASLGGKILLSPGLSPAGEFTTLSHEIAHELLHKCDKDLRPSKKVREAEAEAVSFVACQAIGLDTNTASSDYIQLYRGDKDTLLESFDRIQQTALEIIRALAKT